MTNHLETASTDSDTSRLRSACWQITTRCNMRCPTCLRYRDRDRITTDRKKELVSRLALTGFHGVSIAGGEPFLDPDLPEIVVHAKQHGLYVGISTNGTLLLRHDWSAFDAALDEMSFLIDGSTPELQAFHRASDSDFEVVCAALSTLKTRPFHLLVVTVLTKANKDDLPNILHILLRAGVRRWKVNRFCSTGDGARNAHRFAISDEEFEEAAAALAAQPSIRSGEVGVVLKDSTEAVMQSSVNISPDGGVMLFKGRVFSRIGTLWDAEGIRPMLRKHGFRFDIHNARSFRGQYLAGTKGAAAGGWDHPTGPGEALVVCSAP